MRIDMGQRGHITFSWVQGSERTMSEHDDTLLDEDLGDEEYDLGNDEEEALLADDYEVDRQNSYKGEEETDDVLDLGVTDALDDLEADDENVEFNRSKTDEHSDHDFYKEEDVHQETGRSYYEQVENREHKEGEIHRHDGSSENALNAIGKGDLREKLQKNVQKVYVGDGQPLEDDECEEARERRNRFQNERTMISPKMNNNIPDTLENVVTSESSRPSFRGRGRGRGARGSRGGRFITQNCASFNPRFGNTRNVPFENQQQVCRPPLLEARPPFPLGVPNSMQNQQIVYQPNNSQVQSFQQFPPNGPTQQGPPRFVDNRPQFNPGQFQGATGPRPLAPRMNFEPRVSLHGSMQRPPYNCPPNQPAYLQMQPPPFQNTGAIMQDGQGRPSQSNQGPLLHGNPGGSLLGNPNPLLQGNQPLPMQGFPRQHRFGQAPLVPSDPNVPIPSQPAHESRQPFQEPRFNLRPPYMEQVPNNQFNNNTLPVPQQPVSSMSGVALPSGHKILINPHFRGAVQPSNDARLAWDSSQHQGPPQPQIPNNQFNNPPAPYQNQNSYNQSQQGSAQYQQTYSQNKNDDPYAYFSDVWQENRPQKTQGTSPTKQYSLESSYTRESSYNDSGSKYKSDNQWEQRDNYQEEHRGVHQSYRERDLPSRPRSDHVQKSRLPSSGTYRGDSYDQNQKSASSRPMNVTSRGPNKSPQKRVTDTTDRSPRDPSPKRSRTSSRNLHEVRTVEIPSDVVSEKKEEDSDPEMQEYRKKMEEQKRLREIILREKENRRKMAAMEKQNEEVKNDPGPTASENTQQEAKPVSVLMGVKDTVINKARTCIGRGRGHPVNAQNTEANERPNIRIVRTIQPIQSTDSLNPANAKDEHSGQAANQFDDTSHVKQLTPQPSTRRVVIHKPLTNSQKIATTIQKTVSNLQKGQPTMQNKLTGNLQNIQKVGQVQAMKKQVAGQKVVNKTQRVVVPQKSIGTLQKSIINVQDIANANVSKVVVNTQNSQRVVLQKPLSQAKKVTDIKTNTVKLENLAASTSEVQIRRMCQGIGTIESIHMGEGSATIVFKTQSAAMVFHKKYQRKMLDLSLITVRLVPQTSVNKAATVVNKS